MCYKGPLFMLCIITGATSEKVLVDTLRKQAYSNVLKILPPKNENFQIKVLIFYIFLLKTKIVGTR